MSSKRQQNFDNAADRSNKMFDEFCKNQEWCKVKRFTLDRYAAYDVVYNNDETLNMGEIKYRRKNILDFSTWFIEKSKYDDLMEIKNKVKTKVNVTYINHFIDGYTAIWDITNLDMSTLATSIEWLPENDFSDQYLWKPVYHLPYWMAKKYNPIIKEENKNNYKEEDEYPF